MKRSGRGRSESCGTKKKERKRAETLKERRETKEEKKGSKGEREELWGLRDGERNGAVRAGRRLGKRKGVAAEYQRRTTKVIKLGWIAGSDRLVGHSIGNSMNLWTS